jgi:phosphotransferase system HPr-like phosphotransfer protein
METEKPKTRIEQGYTIVETEVISEEGFSRMRALYPIAEECKKYNGNIYLQFPDEENKANCKSIVELLLSSSPKGTKLIFLVEGTDEKAEKMALRLCSRVATMHSYEERFDLFEENNKY